MRRALDALQARVFEEALVEGAGVSVADLMEAAGRAVARRAALAERVVVVAGKGNNAGDGWVCARVLHEEGKHVRVVSLVDPSELPDPAAGAARESVAAGVAWEGGDAATVSEACAEADLVIDAIFGFGIRGAVKEPIAAAVRAVNESGCEVLSVDVPSGVEASTGVAHGEAVRATRTVALLSLKLCHVLQPSASLCGEVELDNLGFETSSFVPPGAVEVWEDRDAASVIPRTSPADHKGSRGRVLVVGGSRGMTGAVVLSAWAALRSGAGYVIAAVPEGIADIVDSKVTPVVVRALPDDARAAAEAVAKSAADAHAVLVGPGMGASDFTRTVVRSLWEQVEATLLVDADGLNALAGGPVPARPGPEEQAPVILTPHPGEAARLLGRRVADIQADRVAASREISEGFGATVVLKGAGAVVCEASASGPEGSSGRTAVITSGTAALATMGTGDVLAGLVTGFLAQGLSPYDAACAGAHVHGVAGRKASEALTDLATTAEDVLDSIPAALAVVSSVGV